MALRDDQYGVWAGIAVTEANGCLGSNAAVGLTPIGRPEVIPTAAIGLDLFARGPQVLRKIAWGSRDEIMRPQPDHRRDRSVLWDRGSLIQTTASSEAEGAIRVRFSLSTVSASLLCSMSPSIASLEYYDLVRATRSTTFALAAEYGTAPQSFKRKQADQCSSKFEITEQTRAVLSPNG